MQNNLLNELWQILGRLHPLVVHFPISLLWVGLLLECIAWRKKSDQFQSAIGIILWVGTITAALAVGLGFILINQDDYTGNTITIHQWSGIVTAILSGLTLYAFLSKETKSYRLLLFLTVLGVSFAGHYGAHSAASYHFVVPLLFFLAKNNLSTISIRCGLVVTLLIIPRRLGLLAS